MKKLLLQSIIFCIFSVVHAEIYRSPITQNHEHVVIFFDLDKVVLNESGGLGKLWAALITVPLKKSIPILLRQRKRLAKLVKEARYDGQKLKGLKANLDCILEAEPSLKPYRAKLISRLNKVSPRTDMIRFLNTVRMMGVPLAIATNNDYESLRIKIDRLNRKLCKKDISPFIYDACFCAGSCPELVDTSAPHGIPAGFVYGGKDTDEYFAQFFDFIEAELGFDKYKTLFIYIDDLGKNISRARRVAQQEGVQLYAVYRNKADKKIINEMRILFRNIPIPVCIGI
jgi:hypothetical protein